MQTPLTEEKANVLRQTYLISLLLNDWLGFVGVLIVLLVQLT